jgi:prepilin-type N-terminal cleavage/methylation domain-containing protein
VLWSFGNIYSPQLRRRCQFQSQTGVEAHLPCASRAAFTLVELLVVIAILAILLSILVPVLGRVRAHARFTLCKANLRSLLQAHRFYSDANNGLKPPLFRFGPIKDYFDRVSPNIKDGNVPVGNGILVQLGLVPISKLLDPSEAMTVDTDLDLRNWQSASAAGSSYVYFYSYPLPTPLKKGQAPRVKYSVQQGTKPTALMMDFNTEANHPYVGEYSGRTWVNHPAVKKFNVAYTDGAVLDFPITQFQLKSPGGAYEEIEWFDAANGARR